RSRSFLRTGLPAPTMVSSRLATNPRSGTPRSGYRGSDLVLWHMGDAFRRRSESVSFLSVFCRVGETTSMPLDDPGCVKTPKGRSRRGIVFYRHRGFRVVLQPLATTLVLEKKVILCVPHALAF